MSRNDHLGKKMTIIDEVKLNKPPGRAVWDSN